MKKPLKIHQKAMPERGREKGCQNDGKRSQKGAKMETKIRPKCIQKSTFGKAREKGAKRNHRINVWIVHFGAIFH